MPSLLHQLGGAHAGEPVREDHYLTERLLGQALDRLLERRSAVIIAHRLATVERADEILILGEGAAIEHGPRHALASDPDSHLYRLLHSRAPGAGLEEVLT